DELAESVRPFLEAGFTDIALVQVGDDGQDDFLAEAAGPLLERLRSL
ncbi:MAG: class F420-dependent oxidoreductase, partial [Mycetocola sp.]|nr:class F420-dependent oxidoreductase [Mycetocola sp.]